MSIFAVTAYVFFFAAAVGHDPAFTFCVLLAFAASLAAAAVILNRRYEPRQPPAEIKVRPNYNLVRSNSVMAMWPQDKGNAVSKGEAYCIQTLNTSGECAPPARTHIRGKDSNIPKNADGHYRVDLTKTDSYRPYVGQWSDAKGASWTEERTTFMTDVSRVPGMNAMSVFRDQWAVVGT